MARRQRQAARATARVGALVLVVAAASCGARLTPAQHAVYDAPRGPVAGPTAAATAVGAVAAGPVISAAALPAAGAAGPGSGVATSAPTAGSAPTVGSAATTTTPTVPAAGRASAGRAPSAPSSPFADGTVTIDPRVCQAPAGGPGVTATEVDLGTVTTQTGPIPGAFAGVLHGVQAFATYLNSLGGICGRKVVVKGGDDNLQVSQNAAATQSLAGAVFSFVGSFSADDQGMATVLKGTNIPDVGQALTTERFDLPNNFSPEPIAGWNEAPYFYFKKLYPDAAKHMAILTINQAQSQKNYQDEKAALERAGYTFVYTDPNIEPTQSDFNADAQAMKAAGAQGVAFIATAQIDANLARAIANIGYSLQLPTYATTAYDQAFLATAGSAAEGTILELQEAMFQGEDIQTVPMVATLSRWYQALYHAVPDEFATYSWMSGLLFVQGLNRGGALTQPALLSGLRQVTHFDGGGLVAPDDPAHKTPPNCYLIVRVTDGRFVRDSSNPSGFNCQFTPNYYFSHH